MTGHMTLASKILRAGAPMLFLALFLVGSCKTSDLPASYGSDMTPDARHALFPVRLAGGEMYPARGYIDRAQDFVSAQTDTILKLTGEEITYLFGSPDFVRHEHPAEIWQYMTEDCVLDIYFYHGDEGATLAAHFDLRPRPQPVPESRLASFLSGADIKKNRMCVHDVAASQAQRI